MATACGRRHAAHVDVVLHRDDRPAAARGAIHIYERAQPLARRDALERARDPSAADGRRWARQIRVVAVAATGAAVSVLASGVAGAPRIASAIFSATIIVVALMFTRGQSGMIEASTTRSASTP